MNDTEAFLRKKEEELVTGLQNREGLETEAVADFGDQIQRAADRAIVIESLDRSSALLREVQAALSRIEEGTYGRCLICGEGIGPRRLKAVPWAALCYSCQEQADSERASNPVQVVGSPF